MTRLARAKSAASQNRDAITGVLDHSKDLGTHQQIRFRTHHMAMVTSRQLIRPTTILLARPLEVLAEGQIFLNQSSSAI